MNIKIEWDGTRPPNEDISEIEENISKEIAHLSRIKPDFPSSVFVKLSMSAGGLSIDGVGVASDGKVAVTFTYPLLGDRRTSYTYHP